VQGDVRESLNKPDIPLPDVVIVDPPRAGLHVKVIEALSRLPAKRLVYISCNPTTFARDAKALHQSGLHLTEVQPVDMFPMTTHIELVSLFEKK
jgi:23S rRNA (uracil1939-C5)-methyltransferase